MSPFRSLADYETLIYTLQQSYPSITRSTLTLARRGRTVANLMGELHFDSGTRLVIYEILTWDEGSILIESYSYEAWHSNEKLYWYDPQPHPNDPSLVSTHPHHKHVPPDIKHNRIPAPEISFEKPNLPFLIDEIVNIGTDTREHGS